MCVGVFRGLRLGLLAAAGFRQDLLEVKKPAVLGLLKLAALQFHGLEPGPRADAGAPKPELGEWVGGGVGR